MKRIIFAFVTMFIIIIFNFTLIHLAPGSTIDILSGEQSLDPAYVEMMRIKFGLDKPFHEQLIRYVLGVLSGELGKSYVFYGQSVLSLILERVPATFLLIYSSIILASLFGIFLGVFSSGRVHTWKDNFISIFSLMGYSIPVFWLAIMLMLVFSINMDLFPVQGMTNPRLNLTGINYFYDVIHHLTLPVVALGVQYLALVSRLTRSQMIENFNKKFVVLARVKGLNERRITYTHVLRNSLLPVITVIGLNAGNVMYGAVFTETIFGWPGIGRLLNEAIFGRDYPLLMGILLFVALMVTLTNLLIDILYGILDPRVRYT